MACCGRGAVYLAKLGLGLVRVSLSYFRHFGILFFKTVET